MRVVNSFMKLLSYVFVFIFCLICLTTAIFLIVKNMISYDSIHNYVSNTDIFDYSIEKVGTGKHPTIRQNIEDEMLKFDVPVLVTDSVLDSGDVSNAISSYISDYFNCVIFSSLKPAFPTQKVLDAISVEYSKQLSKPLSDNQRAGITSYINSLGEKVDNSLLETNELSEMISLKSAKNVVTALNSNYIVGTLVMVIVIIFVMTIIVAKF